VVLCRGEQIDVACLPGELNQETPARNGGEAHSTGSPLVEAEAAAILEMLRRHGGHRGRTAAALGIDKTTLWRKMRKYAITYP
jgi:transcriptional regulator of acetoin/glycerol metabolism